MKKIFIFVLLCVLTVFQAHAVLKEKDLFQTLRVLRAELEQAYNKQQNIMAVFEKRNVDQHTELIRMMQNCNQIALMLYSQSSDFTFDMAYACQAATEQYRQLKSHHMPYNKMKARLLSEIDRYDALIAVLENLPPKLLPNGELSAAPDSLQSLLPKRVLDTASNLLYFLDEQGLKDREACIEYATALRDNYVLLLEKVESDQEYYELVANRVEKLNEYALSRYENLQKNIFVNGGENYFQTLKRFRMSYLMAKKDIGDRYKAFSIVSEWRGPVIWGISSFMFFCIIIASLLSYVLVRWVLPKKWRMYFKAAPLVIGTSPRSLASTMYREALITS